MHIAIAGNIGAGKTTLSELLAKHYKWTPHYEDVDENPYLNDFYNDIVITSYSIHYTKLYEKRGLFDGSSVEVRGVKRIFELTLH